MYLNIGFSFNFFSFPMNVLIYFREGVEGVWVQLLWGHGARARILVLREYIWNALTVLLSSQPLTIPAPQVFLRVGWSILLVPPWVTASRFLAGNRVAELQPTTFSSLLLFRVFLSFLTPQRYSTCEGCLLRLLLNNNNNFYNFILAPNNNTN